MIVGMEKKLLKLKFKNLIRHKTTSLEDLIR